MAMPLTSERPTGAMLEDSSLGKVKTFSEQVGEHIKKCILKGVLKPGDPVRECDIATRLGISRGPVREALQKLQQEDLITGEPQKQRFITSLEHGAIFDRYSMAGTLEGACIVQSLEYLTPGHLDYLERILAEMEAVAEKASGLRELSEIDEKFHEALLEGCRNRLMVQTSRAACVPISKFLYTNLWDSLYTPAEFIERHRRVLDVVKGGNPDAIRNALLEHYSETGQRFAAKLQGHA